MSEAGQGLLARAVAHACRAPGRALALVLGLHLIVWTALPVALYYNLQLDLAEDLALGKEWQLGYWKHPPLPWWIADAAYRLAGDERIVYLLGPLAAVICLYGAWLLAAEIVGRQRALLAVLALEGLHFFNFSVIKFAHDQVQLPFWAFAALLFYRAVKHERARDWLLAGALLALCFWSKYAAFALAATLGLILLFDPLARKAWRTPGPYLMALAFLVVLAPNVWWLVHHDFMPFHYVDARAKEAAHWWQYIWYPVQWTGSQFFYLLPTLALIAIVLYRARRAPAPSDADTAFTRRYVTALALGPFVVTTLVAAPLGRLPVAMWGYPLWTFAPLALLMWWEPLTDARRLRLFALALIAICVAFPAAYAGDELLESFVRPRAKATQFPGRLLAQDATRLWREKTGQPLVYVAGTEFAANNVVVYSPDRPHAIVHADPRLSPWVDPDDLRRRGVLLVWEQAAPDQPMPEDWKTRFPGAQTLPSLVLPRHTLHPIPPARIGLAVVPPAAAPGRN